MLMTLRVQKIKKENIEKKGRERFKLSLHITVLLMQISATQSSRFYSQKKIHTRSSHFRGCSICCTTSESPHKLRRCMYKHTPHRKYFSHYTNNFHRFFRKYNTTHFGRSAFSSVRKRSPISQNKIKWNL